MQRMRSRCLALILSALQFAAPIGLSAADVALPRSARIGAPVQIQPVDLQNLSPIAHPYRLGPNPQARSAFEVAASFPQSPLPASPAGALPGGAVVQRDRTAEAALRQTG